MLDLDDALPLADLGARFEVVGAVVGASVAGRRAVAVHGAARPGTSVARETLFLAGSVTKAMTASIVALLVDDGLVGLDDPVVQHVPAFRVADPAATAAITVRHLLAHTAGFDGDLWPDLGDDPAAGERLVASLGDVAQLFAPGTGFSYNNVAYAVLGRLVEVVAGAPFEQVLRERIAGPCSATLTTDRRAVGGRSTAIGHERGPGGWQPVGEAVGPACLAAAGSRTWASIDDLLAFGELHLGRHGGARVASALAAMREPQIEVPDPNNGGTMALGVWLDDRWGSPLVFHDGGVAGQSAYLRILPELDAVLAVMCTGGVPQVFHRHVFAHAAGALLDLHPPLGAVADPTVSPDPGRCVGTFAATAMTVEISGRDGLSAEITWRYGGDAASSGPIPLQPVDERVLIGPLAGRDYVVVLPDGDGPADHVLAGLRRANRVA